MNQQLVEADVQSSGSTLSLATVVRMIRDANGPENDGEGYLVCVSTAGNEFFRGAVKSSVKEIQQSAELTLVLWEPRRNGGGPTGLELLVPVTSMNEIEIEW